MNNCVFCGKEIIDKTKEHIIPKWLIKLTGDEKREITLGYKYWDDSRLEMKIPFNTLTIGSCAECNKIDSKLENESKGIIENIVNNNTILYSNINVLCNFFDKLRIGMWLYYNKVSHNMANIVPHFSINNRINRFDRILGIYRINKNEGMRFTGVNTLAFQLCPSVACFTIKNYIFLTFSYSFLLAYRFGFPYPKNETISIDKNDVMYCDMMPGTNKVKEPLLRREMVHHGVEIYQPVIPSFFSSAVMSEFYDNLYIKTSKDMSLNVVNPRVYVNGKISNSDVIFIDDVISSESNDYNQIFINMFKYQIDCLNSCCNLDETIGKEEKKEIKMKKKLANDYNNLIIDQIVKKYKK